MADLAHGPRQRALTEVWRPRANRAARNEAAAGLAISMSWHLMVLAVLALTVHPFTLPPETTPVFVELLPQPVPPTVAPPEPTPQPTPLDQTRPDQVLQKPIDVQRRPSPLPPKSLQTDRRLPTLPEPLPPAPLENARAPSPVLARPVEVDRRPSPVPPRAVDRLLPQVSASAEAAPEEAAPIATAPPASSSAVQVLTNQQVIQAPVEIRPPSRPATAGRNTAPALPPASIGELGGAPPEGGGGGGAVPLRGLNPNSATGRVIGGFDANGVRGGLRMGLGCATPDTYKLTPEERAACLDRFGAEAKSARALGLNMDPTKQAGFDRAAACRAASLERGVPGSTGQSDTTGTLRGLGANPRLRDCPPGLR